MGAPLLLPDPDVANAGIRWARWVVIVVVAAQFLPETSPAGVAYPFPRAVVGAGVLLALLGLQLLSWLGSRVEDCAAKARIARAELALSTAVAVLLVWLFQFDPASPMWAIVIFVVVEAAVRDRLVGALSVWGVGVLAFILGDLWASRSWEHVDFHPEQIVLRGGVLLVVALACGMLAHGLVRQMRAERAANAEAERRAQALATVTAASRSITSLDPDDVLAGVVDAAIALGFDAAEISEFDEQEGTWRSRHSRGLPESYAGSRQRIDAGIAGRVRAERRPVVVEDYTNWEHALPELCTEGFATVLAVPVWSGERLVAVLSAASRAPGVMTETDQEAMELLAAQASRALENAVRFTERAELEAQLKHQAFHDALTGLPNRELFRERLDHALTAAQRDRRRVGVLFLDLDGFKIVNDSLGHQSGDSVLRQAGERLAGRLRPGDTLARFGGDEFTVLLDGIGGSGEAVRVGQRLLDVLREPLRVGEAEIIVSASIGVASGGPEQRAEDLLLYADRAMYRAKEQGKGAIEVYEEVADREHAQRVRLDGELRRGISDGQLALHYQPLVAAADRSVVAVEALLRWSHPEHGPISPTLFIPLAERSGAILALGRWVLREGLRAASGWPDAGASAPRLHVNVSFHQLQDPGFVPTVAELLEEFAFPARRLTLELTEGAVIEEGSERLLDTLAAVKLLGVGLAVDDFGRGFSSLRYLRDLPVDEVKLDRALIGGLHPSPEDRAIVRWTIELAHELGMRVTAEGVEESAQAEQLQRYGCDVLQGFLFHRPMPLDALLGALGGADAVGSPGAGR